MAKETQFTPEQAALFKSYEKKSLKNSCLMRLAEELANSGFNLSAATIIGGTGLTALKVTHQIVGASAFMPAEMVPSWAATGMIIGGAAAAAAVSFILAAVCLFKADALDQECMRISSSNRAALHTYLCER